MRETKTNKNGKWCRREKRIEKNSKQKEKKKLVKNYRMRKIEGKIK